MTSRERQVRFIEEFGRESLRSGVTEMLACFGPDWLTDEQVKDIVQYKVEQWRAASRRNVRNRAINQDRLAALANPHSLPHPPAKAQGSDSPTSPHPQPVEMSGSPIPEQKP